MTTTNTDTYDNPIPHAQRAAVRRLALEFGANFTRDVIARTVEGGIADLAGVPIDDLPELAERVARQRLSTALERDSGGFPAGCISAIVELHPPTAMEDP